MKKLAPIVLFVYNRLDHTMQTVEALQKNKLASESNLFIFSDAPKNTDAQKYVHAVREYIKTIDSFKSVSIIEREKNWGLANSIIDGVTTIINEYDKVIVLEDDLVSSPYFLTYMNEALYFYEKKDDIFSITGFSFEKDFMNFKNNYSYDTYLNIRAMSWSWATWKDRWKPVVWDLKSEYLKFKVSTKQKSTLNSGGNDLSGMFEAQMNGRLDSWYVRWTYHAIMNKKLTVYPVESLIINIGHDGTGVHCSGYKKNLYGHTELSINSKFNFVDSIKVDKKIVKNFNKAFHIKLRSRIKSYVKKILGLNK